MKNYKKNVQLRNDELKKYHDLDLKRQVSKYYFIKPPIPNNYYCPISLMQANMTTIQNFETYLTLQKPTFFQGVVRAVENNSTVLKPVESDIPSSSNLKI
jgi:hypothetical protein